MADRKTPIRKTPADVLQDARDGHTEASSSSHVAGKKYLENFIEKNHSIPNAVKFFIYDLLSEDAYNCKDDIACLEAVSRAISYLDDARTDAEKAFKDYLSRIRCFERGISVAVNSGELKFAMELCEKAIQLGLGRFYLSKKESIEGMF